jgi:class 3 adenylate cyclase
MGISIVPPQQGHAQEPRTGSPGHVPSANTSAEGAFALLLFELRRLPRPDTRITADIEGIVLNRCILVAVETLTVGEAAIDVAGTENRPVVEARFQGHDAPARAVAAALDVLAGVRRVQRAAENEFQVVGALTVGTATETGDGVLVTTGAADVLLNRLRERAGPGQILLSEDARAACEEIAETVPARGVMDTPGEELAQAHVLRGLR